MERYSGKPSEILEKANLTYPFYIMQYRNGHYEIYCIKSQTSLIGVKFGIRYISGKINESVASIIHVVDYYSFYFNDAVIVEKSHFDFNYKLAIAELTTCYAID